MRLTAVQQKIVWKRLADLSREVGTLLLAFAPLDYALQETINPLILAGFGVAGGTLFLIALVYDIRSSA